MKEIIKFQGKETKIGKHPSISLPFCPLCGEELFCLFDSEGRVLSFLSDLILFCKKCETFWYNNTTYFSLRKIYDLKEFGIEIVKEGVKWD
jgi:hypothetical protein